LNHNDAPGGSSQRSASPELTAVRERYELAAPTASEPGVRIVKVTLDGVPCLSAQPRHPTGTAMYLHGGGYATGSAQSSAAFGARLAATSGAQIVLVDYRLAPEYPFPCALEDSLRVYAALLDGKVPGGSRVNEAQFESLAIVGDSAGGGLAAATVLAAGRSGLPGPVGLVLFSPLLDLTLQSGTYLTRSSSDQLVSRDAVQITAERYLQGRVPSDNPLASPLFAHIEDFPPTLLHASSAEVLLDDTLRFSRALALAGIEVELHVKPHLPHVWPICQPELEQSVSTVQRTGAWLRSLWAESRGPACQSNRSI
jgi:monoterpene epsilon-lactone hydrolase